jgi:hypothetical protein
VQRSRTISTSTTSTLYRAPSSNGTLRTECASRGATIFVLTEELSAAHAARNAAGWDTCLDELQFGRATEPWTARFGRYVATFEPVLGRQDGPPEGVAVS